MASVERIMEYANLEPEGKYIIENAKISPEWPRKNTSIEVRNLSLRYRPELDLVLN